MYVTIVCVTRDDDYGERGRERFAAFARSIVAGNDWELLVVEWNPLEHSKTRKSMIDIINDLDLPYKARVVTVPFTEHRRLLSHYPVIEYWGKNIGLIHSKGEYVLFTNPDIVFQPEMFDHLSKRPLSPDHIYRSSRFDVDRTVLDCEDILAACKEKVINRYFAEKDPGDAAGDFTLVHNTHAKAVGGYIQTTLLYTYLDSEFVYRLRDKRNLSFKVLHMPIYHIDHERTDKGANETLLKLACKYYNPENMGLNKPELVYAENAFL
jgi:hypothetical protein